MAAPSTDAAVVPTHSSKEEALEALEALLPGIAERALDTERARRVLPETVDDLRRLGLLRILTPAAYGGAQLDFDAALEVATKLGTACAATAWCYAVWMSHSWQIGQYGEPVWSEVWGESPDTLVCSSSNPRQLELSEVDGGFLVSGHTDFASGCDHSRWAKLVGQWSGGSGTLLVPMDEIEIVDNWYPSGLRGTGSKDLELSKVYVPSHRVLTSRSVSDKSAPGLALLPERMSYKMPMIILFAYTVAAPLVGAAQSAVQLFADRMRHKAGADPDAAPSVFAADQLRLAESSAEVDAAALIMSQAISTSMAAARVGHRVDLTELARHRRDHAYVARLCLSAVSRVFDASGAHALQEENPLQRIHRDVAAGVHQLGLNWDLVAEDYGRVIQGLPPKMLRV